MNKNRVQEKFESLKKAKKKAFIAFVTAGDPSLSVTEKLVYEFEKCGADIIELGVPFSDPLADGPTIQESSERALKKNTTLKKILALVKKIRKTSNIPICLMSYYNPIFHYGESKFIKDAKNCGVDGLILPDLPPEEAIDLNALARKYDIATVYFMSPTTTAKRMKLISKSATGFIYYVSLTGVTGARKSVPGNYKAQIKKAKKLTKTPICVGFGVSTVEHVRSISKISDGVIVGSAIIKAMVDEKSNKNKILKAKRVVSKLTKVL